ncbi:hypothetical protein CUJ86_08420 [Methanofollis fontis]|uniref:Uncharacterized protein n=1 Tax=Methanofollis fontis TaxID=2052832 RepID=A0A483CS09_9EURY|nr:hypothetical protein CUJ86_08420 [Methanofollis fontis]
MIKKAECMQLLGEHRSGRNLTPTHGRAAYAPPEDSTRVWACRISDSSAWICARGWMTMGDGAADCAGGGLPRPHSMMVLRPLSRAVAVAGLIISTSAHGWPCAWGELSIQRSESEVCPLAASAVAGLMVKP